MLFDGGLRRRVVRGGHGPVDLGVGGEEGLEAGEVAGAAEHVHLKKHGERVSVTRTPSNEVETALRTLAQPKLTAQHRWKRLAHLRT